MIAHRIQTVMRADKILVLDKGRIIQQGTHRELMAQDGIYRQIYDLQARIEEEVSATNGRGKAVNGKNGKSDNSPIHSIKEINV
jgi:ABC-type cobalamin/Fe3+-siderophores transport system ATPase subunit